MQINLSEIFYVCPECPESSIKTRNFYPKDQTTTFHFYQGQELTVTLDPPSFTAKVLTEGQLKTRTSFQPDWQVGQFDFATKHPSKTNLVTIFRDSISQTTLPSHQKPEMKS